MCTLLHFVCLPAEQVRCPAGPTNPRLELGPHAKSVGLKVGDSMVVTRRYRELKQLLNVSRRDVLVKPDLLTDAVKAATVSQRSSCTVARSALLTTL